MKKDRPYRKSLIPENAKRVFEGTIFDVYQWEQELYDGTKTTFERLVRPDSVVVFPILQNGDILLVQDSQPARETVITAPTGRVDEGETPEEAAKRELKEETGYAPGMLTLWYSRHSMSKIDWISYVYIAHGCKKVSEPTPEAGEKIEPYPVSFERLLSLISSGTMRDDGFAERLLRAHSDPKEMKKMQLLFRA